MPKTWSRTWGRRLAAVAAAGSTVGGMVVPAATAAAATECEWQVTVVARPDVDPDSVVVTGTDSRGNYSGHVNTTPPYRQVVLWTNGEPRIMPPPDNVGPAVLSVDENTAGTVLVQASTPTGTDSRVFTFSGGHTGAGVYHELPQPEGHHNARVSAINDRGDVVGSARRIADDHSVAVWWPASGAAPVVIDSPDLSWTGAMDVDEDGTILLSNGYRILWWRDGEITSLHDPTNPVIGRAVRGGRAIGTFLAAEPEPPRGAVWTSPTEVRLLEGGGQAEDINAQGLVVGHLGAWRGPAAVWQDTRLVGTLPLPPEATSATVALIGDDDTIFGHAEPDVGPVRWHRACG
jgi:hypothetical protein